MERTEEQYSELLRQAQPDWKKDAKGIRGEVVQVSNARAKLIWESKSPFRRANQELGGGEE